MKAYHLFREGGTCFAYHLQSGRFIGVSPSAYDLLELRLALAAEEAAAAFLERHPGESAVLEEAARL